MSDYSVTIQIQDGIRGAWVEVAIPKDAMASDDLVRRYLLPAWLQCEQKMHTPLDPNEACA